MKKKRGWLDTDTLSAKGSRKLPRLEAWPWKCENIFNKSGNEEATVIFQTEKLKTKVREFMKMHG